MLASDRCPAHLKVTIHDQEIKEVVREGQSHRTPVKLCSGRSASCLLWSAHCCTAWRGAVRQSARRAAMLAGRGSCRRMHTERAQGWTWASPQAVACREAAAALSRCCLGACGAMHAGQVSTVPLASGRLGAPLSQQGSKVVESTATAAHPRWGQGTLLRCRGWRMRSYVQDFQVHSDLRICIPQSALGCLHLPSPTHAGCTQW